jgi:hypothetical protein
MREAVIREIALLVAEEVKTCRRLPDAETTFLPSSAMVSDSPPAPDSDIKVECPDNSIPIFMDPRNFLPTPGQWTAKTYGISQIMGYAYHGL